MGLLRDIRQAAATLEDLQGDAWLRALAGDAYACCAEWFGPPRDPERPTILRQGWRNCCLLPHALRRSYLIMLRPEVRSDADRVCATIGHETYHRVTLARRRGSWPEPWIEETLACMAGLWFTRRCGRTAYVGHTMSRALAEPAPVDLALLRRYRRPRGLLPLLQDKEYPLAFATDVWRVGLALDAVAGWQALASLSQAASLEGWLQSLPGPDQSMARCLLDASPAPPVPEEAGACTAFGYALWAMGRRAEAITQCREAVRLDPTHVRAWHSLGCLLWETDQRDEAMEAWRQALDLDPSHVAAMSSLAAALFRVGRLDEALELYHRALEAGLDLPDGLYTMAGLLRRMGRDHEARTIYERMAAQGGLAARWSRKALAEWEARCPAEETPCGPAG